MKRKHGSVVFVLFIFGFLICPVITGQAQKTGDDIVIGKYRVIHSNILDEDRTLLIYLPRNYENSTLDYPVLYLFYGNHVTTYFAEAVATLDLLGPSGRIPEMIMVGIMNTDRYRDLLPRRDDGSPTGIEAFIQFLKEELFPFIEKSYRTKGYRVVVGPQAAANFTLYTLFEHPELFDAGIINNPFRWRGGRDLMLQNARSFFDRNKSFDKFLFITFDDSDPLAVEGIEYIREFSDILKAENPEEFRLVLNFIEGNDEFLQPLGLRKGLKTLFEDYPFPEHMDVETIDDILGHYAKLTQKYGFELDAPELVLTHYGADRLMEKGKTNAAVTILKYNMKKYPYAANAYSRMANIDLRAGNLENARDYLEKMIELIPSDNAMIRSRLRNVEKRIKESAAYQVEKAFRTSGIETAIRKFHDLGKNKQISVYFNEREFNEFGYRLLNTGKVKEAIEIFRLNVELYPESANVYDSLGEAMMEDGAYEEAKANYQKSLDLDPSNTNAKAMIEKIGRITAEQKDR
jgi:predicted alpha/beta superfamily hydrolase/Tfp pilus assembly protein PilF